MRVAYLCSFNVTAEHHGKGPSDGAIARLPSFMNCEPRSKNIINADDLRECLRKHGEAAVAASPVSPILYASRFVPPDKATVCPLSLHPGAMAKAGMHITRFVM